MQLKCFIGAVILMLTFASAAFTQTLRTVVVITEPKAAVWLDDLRRGTTNESGRLTIKPVFAGAHKIRVRANGFKETTQILSALQKGDVKVPLVKTTDEAEMAFQEAERLSLIDRRKAIEAYRRAINLRPKYPTAQIALARILSDAGDNDAALKVIADARKTQLNFAEASAVEGRIYKANEEEDKAIASYNRAIREGRGIQPEAHTGLGIIYKDRAEAAALSNDSETQKLNNKLAITEFAAALKQLSGATDAIVIYQLLGEIYEKTQEYQKAIALYEEFLRIFPDVPEATAVKSFIVQLKKQMNGEQ